MKRSVRTVLSVLAGLLGIYGILLSISIFSGVKHSGGQPDAYATDISCSRYWFTLGLTWSCDATVVDNKGKRWSYTHTNSALTPADIGTQVPMRSTGFTGGRSKAQRFATAEHKPGQPALLLVGVAVSGGAAIAAIWLLWRNAKRSSEVRPVRDTKFL